MKDVVYLKFEEYCNILENLEKAIKWDHTYFDAIFDDTQIPLPSFIMELEKSVMLTDFYYDSRFKILHVTIRDQSGKQQPLHFTAKDPYLDMEEPISPAFYIKYDYKNEGQEMWWNAKCAKAEQTPLAVGADFGTIFFFINFYLLNLPEVVSEVKERAQETYLEKKKGDKRYKTRTILRRRIYINAKKMNKSHIKHVIKCLCWGVRGHFRHYKDGKVVFIPAYQKGKKRNQANAYEGKTYTVN